MIVPTRRKLITGIAAMAAARVIDAQARSFRGGAANPSLAPVAPAWAAANGFTNLQRSVNFDTLGVFDLEATQNPGFSYYLSPQWPDANFNSYWKSVPPTPASNLILTSEGITLTPTSNAGQAGSYLTSACPQLGNPSAYNGFALGGGGYVEYLAKWDVMPTDGVPCPALWTVSIESMIGTSITDAIELDAPEAYYDTNPPINFWAYDWTNYSTTTFNRSGSPSIGTGVDFTQYHRWGLGWKTQAQNGGTGLIALVLDDAVISTINYSSSGGATPTASPSNPNGVLSAIESQHQILLIGANTAASIYLGRGSSTRPGHSVWQ